MAESPPAPPALTVNPYFDQETSPPVTRLAEGTPVGVTTATVTPTPSLTPFPTATLSPTSPPPIPTNPPVTPTPTLTPSATPTLYPDVWVSGLLWDEERTILYVGSSSGVIYDARISYEPLDETVAAAIADFPKGTLVVFTGDYFPGGQFAGHMVVEQVEQVNLPYSEETTLSAVYTHPDYDFSFAYPEGWTMAAEYDNTQLTLANRPPESDIYSGPGIEYSDPTTIWLRLDIETMPLEAYVQNHLERENIGEDVDADQYRKVIVTEREFNGLPVTQIDNEYIIWGTYRYYVVALDFETILVFRLSIEDNDFVERLLATLSVEWPAAWASGIYRFYERNVLLVGNGFGVPENINISFEPQNEATAETIDALEPGTLIVISGTYTSTEGTYQGHMTAEQVEQVHLPYSEETPLSAVFNHHNNLFSFAYPENWAVTTENSINHLTLENRPPDSYIYYGPGTENIDPTEISLDISVESKSLDQYVLYRRAWERTGAGVPEEEILEVIISEREIGGFPVTIIDDVSPWWGTTYRRYVLELNEEMVLVFGLFSDHSDFAERLITTLSI